MGAYPFASKKKTSKSINNWVLFRASNRNMYLNRWLPHREKISKFKLQKHQATLPDSGMLVQCTSDVGPFSFHLLCIGSLYGSPWKDVYVDGGKGLFAKHALCL